MIHTCKKLVLGLMDDILLATNQEPFDHFQTKIIHCSIASDV